MMGEEYTEHAQDTIEVEDHIEELIGTEKPVFTLRDKQISGKLDLRYRTVHSAVDIRRCYFLDDVYLGGCNFEQDVDFTGCTFHGGVNKIGEGESPQQSISSKMACQKDFTCDEAIFEGPVSFNGTHIEGIASFSKAQFTYAQEEIDFTTFKTDGQFNCIEATFKGSVSFNALTSAGSAFFDGATFEGAVNFAHASFGLALQCLGVTLKGSSTFNSVTCKGIAYFNETTFEGETNFDFAAFGAGVECVGATFKEPVSFAALKCESDAGFSGTTFEKAVSFVNASFSTDLSFSFDNQQSAAVFKDAVSLYGVRCAGDGRFDEARFEGTQEVDFGFSKFGGSASFWSSSFSGPLKLEAVEVTRELDLTAQQFRDVSLYNAATEILALTYEGVGIRYTFPRKQATLDLRRFTFRRLLKRLRREQEEAALQFDAELDLRGFTFQRVRGSKEDALQFAKAQQHTVFSLDPYVQLEEYYEKVGKDAEARDVHYEGRHAMRRNAATSSEVTWTFGRKVSDSFLRTLTGYGVRTGRVAWTIVVLLVVGAIVFSLGDFTPLGETLAVKSSATSASSGAAQNLSDSKPTVMDQISYSVDRFVPLNIGVEDSFEPRQLWSAGYSLIHAVAGWLLIPLFLASWSGLVRGRR
jgi:uncharacterized protein YjbI with pentapeptide repeats